MTFNDYRNEAFRIAKEHGFHEQAHSDEHLKCLVISELMEAVEADRKDKRAQMAMFISNLNTKQPNMLKHRNYIFGLFIKDAVEDELADACIRLFDLAGVRNIDLNFAGNTAVEISPKRTFTENVFVITRLLTGIEDCYVCVNYGLSMIFTLAKDLGIDIQRHIELKMEYNRTRPHKHGKGY